MADKRESPSGGEIKAIERRQRKGEGNYKCGGPRGRDRVRDRDRGRYK